MRADRLVATLLVLQARGRVTAAEVAARLAPVLVGEQDQQRIEQAIDDEIARALNELAAWEPDDPSDIDGDDAEED